MPENRGREDDSLPRFFVQYMVRYFLLATIAKQVFEILLCHGHQ